MATNYKIRLKRFNGTDYDTLNLVSDNIIMSSGNNLQTDFNGLDSAIDDIVYVGDSAPTDPDVKIWLDTDEGGASVVNSVNGKAGTVTLDLDDIGFAELLWTNASPTSTFAAQTISLDLSEYDLVLLECTPNSTNVEIIQRMNVWGLIGQTVIAQTALNTYGSWGGYAAFATRVIQITQSGIIFDKGYSKNSNVQDFPTEDNRRQAPLRIWGIKGVTV